MSGRLDGRRVLVTSADRYLGPPIVDLFRKEGADVVADTSDYTAGADVPADVVEEAGRVDVLVAIFAGPLSIMPFTNMLGPVTEAKDEDLQAYLDELVWPPGQRHRPGLHRERVLLHAGHAVRPDDPQVPD